MVRHHATGSSPIVVGPPVARHRCRTDLPRVTNSGGNPDRRGTVLVEICVDSLPSAIGAVDAGAGRLELCSNGAAGGTTASAGLVEAVKAAVAVPVFVMVRPRPGDFVYDASEFAVMQREIAWLKTAGADGIVSGALRPDGTVDAERTRALVEASDPLPFTFHRAFDHTRDLQAALETLLGIHTARVLTSGGAPTALAGAPVIATLVRHAGTRLVVLAGGGVRAQHAADLVRQTGVREVHARPVRRVANATHPLRGRIPLTSTTYDDSAREEADPATISALVAALAP